MLLSAKGMNNMNYVAPYVYTYPHYVYVPPYIDSRQLMYSNVASPIQQTTEPYDDMYHPNQRSQNQLNDYGNKYIVINIKEDTKQNNTFRTAIWTGNHLQVTLMSIGVGDDIGLERHPTTDQFLRIEDGQGVVQMGDSQNELTFQRRVSDDDAIMVPAGKWHNVINTGNKPLKLYSIYAPPEHPFGTVHQTKADEIAAEEDTRTMD